MDPKSLNGLWSYRGLEFPDYDNFMWIDEARQRIISFLVITAEPLRYGPMLNWYRPESANSISVSLNPAEKWWVREFILRDDTTIWSYGGGDHVWKRLSRDEYPKWLEAKVAEAHSKMDEVERRGEPGRSAEGP